MLFNRGRKFKEKTLDKKYSNDKQIIDSTAGNQNSEKAEIEIKVTRDIRYKIKD